MIKPELYTILKRKSDGRKLYVRGYREGEVWGSWWGREVGFTTDWMPIEDFEETTKELEK